MMDSPFTLQPQQIVYLEHHRTRLFTELIQVAEARGMYWVRPLMLVELLAGSEEQQDSTTAWERAIDQPSTIHDLRHAPDLLWPAGAFQPAIDTDIIEFLADLYTRPLEPEPNPTARRHLQQFIARLWQSRSA